MDKAVVLHTIDHSSILWVATNNESVMELVYIWSLNLHAERIAGSTPVTLTRVHTHDIPPAHYKTV